MKKLRKIVSLLLAVVMMMSLCAVQVVADDGTITVTNATSGKEYNVYKILDVEYSSDKSSYVYYFTSTSDWYKFFITNASTYNISTYVDITEGTDGKYYVTWKTDTDTATVQAFGTQVSNYITAESPSATATQTATDSTVEFTGLALGYYLVTSEVGSLVSLNTTNPSMEVADKNATPTIAKAVATSANGTYSGSSTADFSDTIYYKVTITGIDLLTALTLHDELPDGFTFGSVTSVLLYENSGDTSPVALDSSSEYTVTNSSLNDNCDFEVSFAGLISEKGTTSSNYETKVTSEAAYIEVYYTATIEDGDESKVTIGSTGNTNNAWLVSSTAETTDSKSSTGSAVTYIYDFYVYKYTTGTTGNGDTALSGAKFILYYKDGSTTYYGMFDYYGNLTGWSTSSGDATPLESGSDGFIHFNGLESGITYYLEETDAPDGYSVPSSADNPVSFSITSTSGELSGISYSTTRKTGSYTIYTIEVENSTSSAMPTTGGIGTTIFYVVGGVLVIGAVILLITKKRMKDE